MVQLSLIELLKGVRGRISNDSDRKAITEAITEAKEVQDTLQAVEGMREAQRKYFRTRHPLALKDAKHAEDMVDQRLADEVPMDENQLELF